MPGMDDAVAKAVIKFLIDRGHVTNPLDVFDLTMDIKKAIEAAKAETEATEAPKTAPARAAHPASAAAAEAETEELVPAVPIKKSIQGDYLICLEDGRRVVLLGRYIKSKYNMTPDQYRLRWGLPADYPMVAPNFAERKSAFARTIGFGKSHRPQFKEHFERVKRELGVGGGAGLAVIETHDNAATAE